MKEKNLREVLEKCSKNELIEAIIRSGGMTRATISWLKIIAEIRLHELEAKLEANLTERKELILKLSETAKKPQNYSNDEILKIHIALAKNHKNWKRLDSEYDKISKELYG